MNMDNSIPFPKNFETYVMMALQTFEKGDFYQAVVYLKKALMIQDDDELLRLCLTIMQENEQYSEGIQLLKKYKPLLWQSTKLEPLDLQLLTLLIETDYLEEAKKQITNREKVLQETLEDNHLYEILEQNLSFIEEKRSERRKRETDQIIQESKTILKENYQHQAAFLKKYAGLPREDILSISQVFLHDSHFHPFLKTEMIEILIQKELDAAIEIKKGSYLAVFQVKYLYPISQSPFLKEGKDFLQQKYSQNPHFLQQMESNLFLHCAYFYPFEKEALISVQEWHEAIRDLTFSEEMNGSHAEKELLQNIKQAEKELNVITEI